MKLPLRVLNVEDTENDADLVLYHLRKSDFDVSIERVQTAEAMKAALDRQPWDIVISDFQLPSFSAPAALAILQERKVDIPFIIVSGTISEETAIGLMRAGAADYLMKDRLARLGSLVKRELNVTQVRRERKEAQAALLETEERYKRLTDHALDIIFRYDFYPTLHLAYINPAVETITGYSPQECFADPHLMFSMAHPDDAGQMADLIQGKVVPDEPLIMRWIGKDGLTRWMESQIVAVRDEAGELISVEGITRDITERKRIADTQAFLAQHNWVATGEDFFRALARYLAESLEMDYVCIDELEGERQSAKTVAVYFDGNYEDNVAYALRDTPCGDVVGKTICCFPNQVRHLFPRDVVLQEMTAESYIGITLWSSTGQPIGLIAVIGRHPLAKPKLAQSILELVAVPASGELERKKAENALRESQERFSLAMEATHDGLWDWNVQTGEVYYSPNYWLMLGYAPVESLGQIQVWESLIHPDDRERALAVNQDCVENRIQNFAIEFRMKTQNGDWKWIFGRGKALRRDTQGRALRMIGTHIDITESKRIEQSLRKSENRLSLALRSIGAGVWDWDIENDRLVWDDQMYRLYGVHAEDFAGAYQAWLKGVHPDDKARSDEVSEKARRGELEYDTEFRVVWPNGTIRYLKAYGQFERDENGKALRMIGINHDITQRKLADEKLNETEAILQAALDNSQAGIAIADAPDGKLRYVNQAGLLIPNKKREEIVDGIDIDQYVSSWQIFHFDGTPFQADEVPLARAIRFGEICSKECIVRRADLEDRIVLVNAAPIFNKAGLVKAGIAIFLDITERKRAEEQVQANQVELQRLLAQTEQSRQALLSLVKDQKAAEEQIRRLNREKES